MFLTHGVLLQTLGNREDILGLARGEVEWGVIYRTVWWICSLIQK